MADGAREVGVLRREAFGGACITRLFVDDWKFSMACQYGAAWHCLPPSDDHTWKIKDWI